ncbi:AlkA N-terminal domain-containing protein [Thalassotalea ponticola]|uniref:DNA-3-methyladenine glycosylase 2 family protein n=1 Tax=Thalassotalea ponticola TaxID=1523392 RepID=UPI0025B5BCDA|nr:DNA-3-methyladenine glycosylase 2 [Thalassotalea ponticola]MDN3653208.1 AlkA N-terminal domain-containing protein [Thalassotalea ponticola]
MLLEPAICHQARLSKDRRFDGKFYTAVITTGIYCRPTCPAGPALEPNVRYFNTAEQAESQGFRACKRCKPELAPRQPLPTTIERAINSLQQQPYLNVAELALQLQLSERQLQRLFDQQLSITPQQFISQHRLIRARTLLLHSNLTISDVATIAGFRSLRSFNDNIKRHYQVTPSQLRQQNTAALNPQQSYSVKLAYQAPLDFKRLLEFFKTLMIPGVEFIDDDSYQRSIQLFNDAGQVTCQGWFRVSYYNQYYLHLELQLSDYQYLNQVLQQVRVMFDLDCHIEQINQHLKRDPRLADIIRQHPGLRLPGCFDLFEFSIRAILGQQISVKAATTLAARISRRYGTSISASACAPSQLSHYFPRVQTLANAEFEQLGITTTRIATLRRWIDYYQQNGATLSKYQSAEDLAKQLCKIKGIGPWTAHYIAMRGLSLNDAFLPSDLGVIKAFDRQLSSKQILTEAEAWRPWRAYATMYLWASLSSAEVPMNKDKSK